MNVQGILLHGLGSTWLKALLSINTVCVQIAVSQLIWNPGCTLSLNATTAINGGAVLSKHLWLRRRKVQEMLVCSSNVIYFNYICAMMLNFFVIRAFHVWTACGRQKYIVFCKELSGFWRIMFATNVNAYFSKFYIPFLNILRKCCG